MPPRRLVQVPFYEYVVSGGFVLIAAIIRLALSPFLTLEVPFISFFVAVAASGWYNGLGPALFAAALSTVLAVYLFIPPAWSFYITLQDLLPVTLFCAEAIALAYLTHLLHQRTKQAQQVKDELVAIFNQTSVGIVVLDTQGRILQTNERLCTLLGRTEQELYRESCESLMHPDDWLYTETLIHEVVRADRPSFEVEKRFRTLDGSSLWVRMSVAPVRNLEGRVDCLVAVVEDLTERRRAQEARRRSEERFAKAFSTSPDALVISRESDGLIREVNDSFLELFRSQRHAVLGRPLTELSLIIPKSRQNGLHTSSSQSEIRNMEVDLPLPTGTRSVLISTQRLMLEEEASLLTNIRDVTGWRQAEKALQESESRFRELVERSPFGIYVVDSQFRIAHMNEAGQLGAFRKVRPLIGRDFGEAMRILWLEPVSTEIVDVFRHTLQTGEPYYSRDFLNRRADVNQTEGYEWELHRLTLTDGQHGVICYYYDSTRLREAEAALRYRSEQFETLLNQAPLGVYVVDADFRIAQINPIALPVFGSIPDLIGRNFDEVIQHLLNKTQADEVAAIFRHTLETGEPFVTPEYAAVRIDRDVIEYYEWRLNRITLPNGRYGLVCYFRDISAQVKVREVIRESEERLRLAMDGAGMGAWDVDISTGEIHGDAKLYALLGLPEHSPTGTMDELRTLLHPSDVERIKTATTATLFTESFDEEFRIRRPDGTVRWIAGKGTLLHDSNGMPSRMVGVNYDITERKVAQERALHFTEELEREVKIRTTELLHSQESLRALATELNLTEQRERKRLAAELHDHLAQMLVLIRFKLGQAKQGPVDRTLEMIQQAEPARAA